RPEPETLLRALAELHVRGARIDFTALTGRRRRVDLPTYAFQRESYWPVTCREPSTGGVRYRVGWQPLPLAPAGSLSGWLAITEDERLATSLTEQGAHVTPSGEPAGILCETGTAPEALDRMRTLAGREVPLWFLTRGAVRTGPSDPEVNP